MIIILPGSLVSKCLLLHFKLICDPEVYWIVKKATEMSFTAFYGFITCRKACNVTLKSEGKLLSRRKLYYSLSVHQDFLFLNNLFNFLWFYKILDKSLKQYNEFCNALYQNACEMEELILDNLFIPSSAECNIYLHYKFNFDFVESFVICYIDLMHKIPNKQGMRATIIQQNIFCVTGWLFLMKYLALLLKMWLSLLK